jgi:hypothetical protein
VIQEEREIVKTTKEGPMLLMGQWIVISKPINLKTKGRDIPIVGSIRDNWVDPNQKGGVVNNSCGVDSHQQVGLCKLGP